MIKIFKNNDKEYFDYLRSNPKSFVFNYFQKSSTEYNKLHFSDCETLPKPWSDRKATSVTKVTSAEFFEIKKWIEKNIGIKDKDYSFCKICNPKY